MVENGLHQFKEKKLSNKFLDITGMTFFNWTAIKFVEVKNKNSCWLFRCVCGAEKVLQRNCVQKGGSKSCGCLFNHGESRTRLNRIWRGMKDRSLNPNNPKAHRYSQRGIDICNEWLEFVPFKKWAEANGYADNLQIDRIDNDKGYHPDNCRFVTNLENMRNSSNTKLTVEFAQLIKKMYATGSFTHKTLGEMFGVSAGTVNGIMNGYTFKGI